MYPALSCLPQYFDENGYREPKDGLHSPFQMALSTDLHVFEWIKHRPDVAEAFKQTVLSREHGRPRWGEPKFYPVKQRLVSGFAGGESDVLLVDVGGGTGLDSRS